MNNSRNMNALVGAVFFLSGTAGLIYQVVWLRMLTRFFGSTSAASATVLCSFMLGLAIGSLVGGMCARRWRRKLRLYVIIEFAVAILGVTASFLVIKAAGVSYVRFCQQAGLGNAFSLRVLLAFLCILPPTTLMGATLPLLVGHLTSCGSSLQAGLGRLYSLNTIGACCGVLLTGFVFIGEYGEAATIGIAATLNVLAGLMPLLFLSQLDSGTRIEGERPTRLYSRPARRIALFAFFISGFSALSYELVWSRLLVLYLETSIYAFSIMLATFLAGIGIGSWLCTRLTIPKCGPLMTFALMQIFIGFWAIAGLALFPLFDAVFVDLEWEIRIIACLVTILPVAIVFGWQFPVAVRCCMAEDSDAGSLTGFAYFVNASGTILGSAVTGFVLLSRFGLVTTCIAVSLVNGLCGLALWCASPRDERRGQVLAGVLAVATGVLALYVTNPYLHVVERRLVRQLGADATIYAVHEGVDAITIAAGKRDPDSVEKQLLINGIGITVFVNETKLLTHLPVALVENPREYLLVCFGMGTSTRSASLYPELNVDVVDIVKEVYACKSYFHSEADDIAARPNINLHVNDGRHFLLTTQKKYDIITIDPSPPLHSSGTVNLYTQEFMRICKDHLNPGGVMCLWIPVGPESEVRMIMKTFVNVFPGACLWGGIEYPGLFLTGGLHDMSQTRASLDRISGEISRIPEMGEWTSTYASSDSVAALFLMSPEQLVQFLDGDRVITDNNPYTEFPIWRMAFGDDTTRAYSAIRIREEMAAQGMGMR